MTTATSHHRKTKATSKQQPSVDRVLTTFLGKHKARRLFFVYTACIVVSAVAAGILASGQQSPKLPDPFSAQQRANVPFRLYYPARLPAPYNVDEASLGRIQEKVVNMRITDNLGKGNAFTISQQALPPNFDLEAFYQSFGNRSTITTQLGKATAGTIDNGNSRLVSLVTNEKTWILVQAPVSVELEVIRDTLQGLSPSI
jgi:hypothetical protein